MAGLVPGVVVFVEWAFHTGGSFTDTGSMVFPLKVNSHSDIEATKLWAAGLSARFKAEREVEINGKYIGLGSEEECEFLTIDVMLPDEFVERLYNGTVENGVVEVWDYTDDPLQTLTETA